jgi:hypothetical protein
MTFKDFKKEILSKAERYNKKNIELDTISIDYYFYDPSIDDATTFSIEDIFIDKEGYVIIKLFSNLDKPLTFKEFVDKIKTLETKKDYAPVVIKYDEWPDDEVQFIQDIRISKRNNVILYDYDIIDED